MFLTLESTTKNMDGTIDITVFITNKLNTKKYTYVLSSEFIARKFLALYKKGKKLHGRALVLLKRKSLKKEVGDGASQAEKRFGNNSQEDQIPFPIKENNN